MVTVVVDGLYLCWELAVDRAILSDNRLGACKQWDFAEMVAKVADARADPARQDCAKLSVPRHVA